MQGLARWTFDATIGVVAARRCIYRCALDFDVSWGPPDLPVAPLTRE